MCGFLVTKISFVPIHVLEKSSLQQLIVQYFFLLIILQWASMLGSLWNAKTPIIMWDNPLKY
jgi:hypothetical protein